MVFSSSLTDYQKHDQIGIQILRSRDVVQFDDEEKFNYEPAEILKYSGEEIYFQIDHALPLGSNIAVKTTKQLPDLKAKDGVWTVNRGRVRSCRKMESSPGPCYEVCVQIFETVLQTEIVTSRLGPN